MSNETKNSEEKAKKAIQKLEERVRRLETKLDGENCRHANALKNFRESLRRIKELPIQSDKDCKNHERMLNELQQAIKPYEKEIKDEKKIANLNQEKANREKKKKEEEEEHNKCVDERRNQLSGGT